MSKNYDYMVSVVFRVEAGGSFDVSATSPGDALVYAAEFARKELLPALPDDLVWVCAETATDRMGRSRTDRDDEVRQLHWHDGTDGDDD